MNADIKCGAYMKIYNVLLEHFAPRLPRLQLCTCIRRRGLRGCQLSLEGVDILQLPLLLLLMLLQKLLMELRALLYRVMLLPILLAQCR